MSNFSRSYTKKGPGRFPPARRKQGPPRLRAATGPDSINAKDVFLQLLRRGEISRADAYLRNMKSHGNAQAWMEIVLSQHEALAA